jgi:hypothetical protein
LTADSACRHSSTRALGPSARREGITLIDAKDTAAYEEAGAEAVAAVARCAPPACRPDIFRGPRPGELTVGLDSGQGTSEYQWHLLPDSQPPGGQAFQDSSWAAMVTQWEAARPQRLMLVDGVARTYGYVREHVPMSAVFSIKQVSPKEARALSSNAAAANGAFVITTKSHASTR